MEVDLLQGEVQPQRGHRGNRHRPRVFGKRDHLEVPKRMVTTLWDRSGDKVMLSKW